MTLDTNAIRRQYTVAVGPLADSHDTATILALCDEVDSLNADLTHWIMVADGINHDARCSSHFAGSKDNGLCMRCQRDDLRVDEMTARHMGDAMRDDRDELLGLINAALAKWREP